MYVSHGESPVVRGQSIMLEKRENYRVKFRPSANVKEWVPAGSWDNSSIVSIEKENWL